MQHKQWSLGAWGFEILLIAQEPPQKTLFLIRVIEGLSFHIFLGVLKQIVDSWLQFTMWWVRSPLTLGSYASKPTNSRPPGKLLGFRV